MLNELRRTVFVPLHYWRTILLVSSVGLLIDALVADPIATLLATLACAFVFSSYERRRWIEMPAQLQLGDSVLRLCLVFAVTYIVGAPPVT